MDDNERMPGKQSDREGRNEPEPGTMPSEFVDDEPGNRFGRTLPPDDEESDDDGVDDGEE